MMISGQAIIDMKDETAISVNSSLGLYVVKRLSNIYIPAISQSVTHLQTFTPESNICYLGCNLPEWSTRSLSIHIGQVVAWLANSKTRVKVAVRDERSNLLGIVLNNIKRVLLHGFCSVKLASRAQCYSTFYGRNFQMLIIRQSVCPWLAFQSSLMFVGKVRASFKLEHPKGASLRQARKHKTSLEKTCQGQTLQLIMNIHKLRNTKSFTTLGLGVNIINLFCSLLTAQTSQSVYLSKCFRARLIFASRV